MTSFISFTVVQFYTFTCLIELCFTQKTSELQESKQGDNSFLKVPAGPLHCRIVKIVTHFPLNSNKTPLRQYSLRRHLLETSEGLGRGGGGAGYGISMGPGIFSKIP